MERSSQGLHSRMRKRVYHSDENDPGPVVPSLNQVYNTKM